ncbi:MAG TPA: type II toxin-antitoxin system prevent-host-death family antitoxin [Thermoanaerobaculia bacterium]|nr:type II toxin-antitoxin system prevent-host-death family antitoxin [Thermoanaerobaculia bacterium]
MKVVGARELKTRLGTYLRQARSGVTILITDRGKPIAELRPLSPEHTPLEARLVALAERGLVTPATQPLTERSPIRVRGESVSETIRRDREDRF